MQSNSSNIDFPNSAFIERVFNEEDIRKILSCLLEEDHWQSHVNQSAYNGGWDVIALRCVKRHVVAHPILQCFAHEDSGMCDHEEWVNLPLLQSITSLTRMLEGLLCPLKSVRIMRLHAGADILPHRDSGLSLAYGEARLHIPILSPPGVEFFVAGEEVKMAEGELWYIDADKEHWVINQSDADRIHLVIDCVSNPWLMDKVFFNS